MTRLLAAFMATTLFIGIAGTASAADDRMTAAEEAAQRVGATVRHLSDLPFEFSWDLRMPAPVLDTWIHPNLPTTLFAQLEDGTFHAIDTISGATQWVSQPLDARVELPIFVSKEESPLNRNRQPNDPLIYDYRLYAISQSTLYCIDCEYGQTIWHYELPFEPSTGPFATGLGEGLRIYVGDWTGRIKVISYHETSGQPYVLWQWNLRASTQAQPSGASQRIYVPDNAGIMHAFDVDRERKWTYEAKGTMQGSPLVRGRSLYVGSDDGVFHVLHRFSGELLGRLFLGAPIMRPVFAFDRDLDHVYAWSEGEAGGLHAIYTNPDNIEYTEVVERRHPLEVERLEESWKLPAFDHIVGASPGFIYVTRDESPVVHAVHVKSGDIQWVWDVSAVDVPAEDVLRRKTPEVDLIDYVDVKGLNNSIFTLHDERTRIVSYRLFGQYYR